jgi:CBS domain-containing protein
MRLSEAARLMRDEGVRCLVVVEETGRGRVVIDILTDRDIVVNVVVKDLDARLVSVADAMTADPVVARKDDSVRHVLDVMRRKCVRRVPLTATRTSSWAS